MCSKWGEDLYVEVLRTSRSRQARFLSLSGEPHVPQPFFLVQRLDVLQPSLFARPALPLPSSLLVSLPPHTSWRIGLGGTEDDAFCNACNAGRCGLCYKKAIYGTSSSSPQLHAHLRGAPIDGYS